MKKDKNKLTKLCRLWSIETGAIESLYDLTLGTIKLFLEYGFQAYLVNHISDYVNKKTVDDLILLLKSQQEVVEKIIVFKDKKIFTKEDIKQLHGDLIKFSRFTEIRNGVIKLFIVIRSGKFKTSPNIVEADGKVIIYCPPERTEDEINKLLALWKKYKDLQVSPLILSAWLHHKFIQIHSFPRWKWKSR